VLGNTFYMNAAPGQQQAQLPGPRRGPRAAVPVRAPPPVHGRYWFVLPGLGGGIRLLRDPDAEDDDRE